MWVDAVCYTLVMATSRYSIAELESAVAKSNSILEVMRVLELRPAGGSHSHLSRRIKKLGLDTSHMYKTSHNKGIKALNRKTPDEILIKLPLGSNREKAKVLRRALLEIKVPYKCVECNLEGIWNSKEIILEIDHIDGDSTNNVRSNLRFICPNCHSQCKDTNKSNKYYIKIAPKNKRKSRAKLKS